MMKRSFVKQFLYFAALIVLPVCVVTLLYVQTTQIVERLCMDNYIASLSEACDKMDEHIRAYDNMAVDMLLNTQLEQVMAASSPKKSGESVYSLYVFSNERKNSVYAADALCREYQVISRENELVFRNNSYICGLEFFFNTTVNYPELTYGQWYDALFEGSGRRFLPAQTVSLAGSEHDTVTYIFPLVYNSYAKQVPAVMTFLIDSKDVRSVFGVADLDNAASIYMLAEDGGLVYGTGPGQALLSDFSLFEGASGFFESRQGDTLFAYVRSSYNGMVYAAQVPKSAVLAQMYTVRRTTQVVLAAYLLVSLALAAAFANRASKPLRELANSLMSSLPASERCQAGEVSEFDFIAENMLRLLKRNESLELSDRDKSDALADIALDRLLSGHAKSSDRSLDLLEQIRFPGGWERCCAAALKIAEPAQIASAQDFPIFDLAKATQGACACGETLRHYVHATTPSVIAVVFVFGGSDDAINQNLMEQCLAQMDRVVLKEAGVHPYTGTGRFYDNIYDIYFSYDQAVYAAESISSGINSVSSAPNGYLLRYDDTAQSSRLYYYPIDLEYRLVNCVKSGEALEVTAIFEQLIQENFRLRILSPRMQRQLCYDLRSTLLKTCGELHMQDESKQADLIAQELERYSEPEKIAAIIQNAFVRIARDVNEQKRSHNSGLKDRMLAYIADRYADSQLCVAVIAGQFNLSESYFSQFFKMQTGEMFSNYLEKLRIAKAREIMQANRAIDIESISLLVGYNNSNTFRRAFKRVVGVSPSSYRQT